MVFVLRQSYRRLILALAVIDVVTVSYIIVVCMYTRDPHFFFKNRFVQTLFPNKYMFIDNADTPHNKHVVISHSYEGRSNSHTDMIVPGKYAWIPYPVKRNPSGPFILMKKNGEAIKYTNYTFYPLTLHSRFLINNQNICIDVKHLTFLIMVHTAVPHFNRRKSLRETWANPKLLKDHQSRILFLVGRTRHNTIQTELEIESEKFKDIVQGDFIDDYHNLTHKGVLGYRWIAKYCTNVKFILKTDDDVFVNIFLVIHELLPKLQLGQRIIACRLLTNETIVREGKYAVDPDYFAGYQRSPIQYCTGPFVLMYRNIVPEMYETAKSTPFYWVDDLYLFGILPNRLRNIYFKFLGNVDNSEENALKCFKGENPCTYLAAYAWTHGIMYTYWDSTLIMYKELVQKYAIDVR